MALFGWQMATAEASLRQLAEEREVHIGAAVAITPLLEDANYAETLAREFNMLTAENVMKFGPLRPERDVFDFGPADAIVSFAEEHGMKVRGHVLVWHEQLPGWLESWSRDEMIAILEEHIGTVAARYRGRVAAWDVVNEAVDDDGSLRRTIWLETIGPDYLELAFRLAHEADPDALLFYNDYGGEGLGRKSDAIYRLLKELVEGGVPIHGVGLQMHVSTEWRPSPRELAENISRLNELGLTAHITEMDVRLRQPVSEENLVEQARIYQETLEVCLAAENCPALVLWGFTDRYSWIPRFFAGYGEALPFDRLYQPKPAYQGLLEALKAF